MKKAEGFDPNEPWTDDSIMRAAASDFAVREIRKGDMTPEEGLISAIQASTNPAPAVREALLKHGKENLGLTLVLSDGTRSRMSEEERKRRARARWRARKDDPEFRARDAARKRAYRARMKEAKA